MERTVRPLPFVGEGIPRQECKVGHDGVRPGIDVVRQMARLPGLRIEGDDHPSAKRELPSEDVLGKEQESIGATGVGAPPEVVLVPSEQAAPALAGRHSPFGSVRPIEPELPRGGQSEDQANHQQEGDRRQPGQDRQPVPEAGYQQDGPG
jgi:hypothetical protein